VSTTKKAKKKAEKKASIVKKAEKKASTAKKAEKKAKKEESTAKNVEKKAEKKAAEGAKVAAPIAHPQVAHKTTKLFKSYHKIFTAGLDTPASRTP